MACRQCCTVGPGGSLPEGENIGDIIFWDGTSWVINNDAPAGGDTLMWNGVNWVAQPAGAVFPGYGPAPPDVAAVGSAGVAATVSRSDHTHGIDQATVIANGTDVGDFLVWDGSNWSPNPQGAPSLGDTIVWDGSVWQPQNINPQGAAPFIIQAAWYVDSATGNDTNDGTIGNPLLTLGELSRRLSNRVLLPGMATLLIDLTGTFAEILDLQLDAPGATAITITGHMGAADFSGTIDTYTAVNAGAGTRSSLLDAGATDFTPWKQHRVRMTGGAAAGGVTSYSSVVALTTANIGQLYTIAHPETATVVNAANGDAYTVEPWSTECQWLDVRITGKASTIIRDIRFKPAATTRGFFSTGGNRIRARFFGCMFDCSTAIGIVHGPCGFVGCAATGANGFTLSGEAYQQLGMNMFTSLTLQDCNLAGANNMHDGDGLRTVHMSMSNRCYVIESGQRGFFGCTAVASGLITLQGQSVLDMSAAAALFWGAAGNLTVSALNVQNSCGVMYVTKPTATGATPGNDVVMAGAAVVAWAAIPAVSAVPDNAFVNVRH